MPETPPAYLAPAKVPRREMRFKIDRYLKKRGLPLSDSTIDVKRLYYPYWKIDAILLKLRNRIEEREVTVDDSSGETRIRRKRQTDIHLTPYSFTQVAGPKMVGVPVSLGVRSEYIRLIPFSGKEIAAEFDCLPIVQDSETALGQARSAAENSGRLAGADFGRNYTELYHPRASLVFFPVLVAESFSGGHYNRYVVDGISGRVLSHSTTFSSEMDRETPIECQGEFGCINVTHHRCSTCGEDLPAIQSFVYTCANCQEQTFLEQHEHFSSVVLNATTPRKQDDSLFPFWAMQPFGTDALTLKRMFGGLHDSSLLIVPGFQVANFEALYRLSKRMSAAYPRFEFSALEGFDERFVAATVGPSEALILAEIVIRREEMLRTRVVKNRPLSLRSGQLQLVYAPFHPENYFYVDSTLNSVTFEKSLAV